MIFSRKHNSLIHLFFFRFTIILFVLLLCLTLKAQNSDLAFSHLTTDNGLSNATVTAIMQDSKGFIWFGTSAGLNKFDGYKFTTYENIPGDTTSISSNRIESILEDKDGYLWVGTANGLNRFNSNQNNFTRFLLNETFENNPTLLHISDIDEIDGSLWLTTYGNGLIYYNSKTNIYKNFKTNNETINSITSDNISTLYYDTKKRLWLGNFNTGIDIFNIETKKISNITFEYDDPLINTVQCIFEISENEFLFGTDNGMIRLFIHDADTHYIHYKNNKEVETSISEGNVWEILKDTKEAIWVATQTGLDIFDITEGVFSHVRHESSNPASICSNEVLDIMQDNQGALWFGTYQGGVSILNLNNQFFKHRKHNTNDPKSLTSHSVFTFEEKKDGTFWLGIDHGGLSLFDKNKGTLASYTHLLNNNNSLPSNNVISVLIDRKGELWTGLYAGGLSRFDESNETFIHYSPPETHNKSLNVWDILEDSEGQIWSATLGSGIFTYNQKTNSYTTFNFNEEDSLSLKHSVVWCLLEDNDKNIWVGSMAGLQKYNKEGSNFSYYPYIKQNTILAKTYNVLSIFEDSKQRLWIGIEGLGLNLFNKETNTFKAFTEADGLINNSVNSIVEDKKGNLWISTNKGISKITIDNDNTISNIYNIDKKNGLQENQFNIGATYLSSTGEIFMGNTKGLIFFNPDSIRPNSFIPPVYLTDFRLFNQNVPIDPLGISDSPLKEHISETTELTLTHKQSIFSLTFAALSFTSSENNQYAYKLEGFEDDWNYIGNKREVSYTNLDAGTYIFKVKASNNDGLWNNQPTSLIIHILPPWWETWWFRTLIILIVVGSTIAFYFFRMHQMKDRQRILEQKIKERTQEIQKAKEKIEHTHKQITDSINYASRIQKAVLPSLKLIEAVIPDYFILYKPRDVVSGDFYWSKTHQNYLILVAADCTGHGVPGAFVSMLGISFLNEISQYDRVWKSEDKASTILELLRDKVKVALGQKGNTTNSKEGMDLALCIINMDTKILQYAGANNPLCIIRNEPLTDKNIRIGKVESEGDFSITQIKPDPMPIGIHSRERPFANYEIQLQSNDKLYVFSDGYIDQFGGEEGKKYMMKNFRSLLLQIHDKPMSEQKQILESTLKDWMGNTQRQIDDILIIGVKI